MWKNETVKSEYGNTLEKYLIKWYISETPQNQMKHEITSRYLQHLPFTKMDRQTMKVWIMFDATAKNNGITIKHGPKLQNEFICDIEEMYIRVGISP
jgi:hypothetical protein